MDIPEIGIGLATQLYPTPCSVVKLKTVVEPPKPVVSIVDPRIPSLEKTIEDSRRTIASLIEKLKLSEDTVLKLRTQIETIVQEYERKLFVASAANRPQQVPIAMYAMQPPNSSRVEIIEENVGHQNKRVHEYIDDSLEARVLSFDELLNSADTAIPFSLQFDPISDQIDEPEVEEPVLFSIQETVAPVFVPISAPVSVPVSATVSTPVSTPVDSRVRRVDMSDLSKPGTKQVDVASLIANIPKMGEKDVSKLSVETITDMLTHLGETYIKPKSASVKLLMKLVPKT